MWRQFAIPSQASDGIAIVKGAPGIRAFAGRRRPEAHNHHPASHATNYYPDRDGRFPEVDQGRLTSSEVIARHLNQRGWSGEPRTEFALPVSSDYPEAKRLVGGSSTRPASMRWISAVSSMAAGCINRAVRYLRPLTAAELLATIGVGGEQPPAP